MRVLTFKANPKTIFGIVLAITGIIVIILSFAGNHSEKTEPTSAAIGCANTRKQKTNHYPLKVQRCLYSLQ